MEQFFVIIHHSCDDVGIYECLTLEEVYECLRACKIDLKYDAVQVIYGTVIEESLLKAGMELTKEKGE